MGLDIHIGTENYKELFSADYYSFNNGSRKKHSLSRTFYDFMSRRHIVDGEPELDQIGKITGIDISPLYAMEDYWDEEAIERELSFAKNDEKQNEMLKLLNTRNEKLTGNINLVQETISLLIDHLSGIDNLELLLNDNGLDTLGYNHYFSNFSTDKGDGYIGNNFGQDLRNFKRFLEFAKSKGRNTVWFNYG